jgi:hypothetical protein
MEKRPCPAAACFVVFSILHQGRKMKEAQSGSNLYLGKMEVTCEGEIPTISLRNSWSATPTKEIFE